MTDVTRRALATAAGLIGAGISTASAQILQSPELRGRAVDGKVELPPIAAGSVRERGGSSAPVTV